MVLPSIDNTACVARLTNMRVRILAGHLNHEAGSHIYHNELARRLANRGHSVSVICFQSDHKLPDSIDVRQIENTRFELRPVMWRIAPLSRYRYCRKALRALRPSRPDIVIGGEHLLLKPHFELFPDVPWIYLPHSLTVRDEISHYDLAPSLRLTTISLYTHLQLWALAHSWCTVRFTSMAGECLRAAYRGKSMSRFVTNPIGVELPAATGRTIPPGGLRLLIVGRLVASKGIDIALDALRNLTELPWHLFIVGGGEQRAVLQRRANNLGLSQRITFVGQIPDPSSWYARCDLLLFPSKLESLGLVILEAMSHGMPCLAFRPDQMRFRNVNDEIIQNDVNGLLVSSPEEFSKQLRRVLEHPDSLLPLGAAARTTIVEKHSWNGHLERYERLFAHLQSLPCREQAKIDTDD